MCVVSLGIGMVPVIAIPYWARTLRMPPAGVKTDGLVELVTTPSGSREAGETWSYPDFETLREADTGMALIGWKSGESKIAVDSTPGGPTESVATHVRLRELLQDDRRGAGSRRGIRRDR